MGTFKELTVYKKAFALAMRIFEASKRFPVEERYSLTDQIRRSSRSVCICIAEGYRKRIYPAHFVSKISDSDMENSETLGWLDFAIACKYLTDGEYSKLVADTEEIGRMLGHIVEHPEKYLPKK